MKEVGQHLEFAGNALMSLCIIDLTAAIGLTAMNMNTLVSARSILISYSVLALLNFSLLVLIGKELNKAGKKLQEK